MQRYCTLSVVGCLFVASGGLIIFYNGMNDVSACTSCTATPPCDSCTAYSPEPGMICREAKETWESSALTGACIWHTGCCKQDVDGAGVCEGSGTTGWNGAYCDANGASEIDICSRITVKKDKHKWQATDCAVVASSPSCNCSAEFLDDKDGCECVAVCSV